MNGISLGSVLAGAHKTMATARKQARQIVNEMRGRPNPPSFTSMTLDADDVRIAREWLRRRGQWRDEATVREYERQFAAWNGSLAARAFLGGRVALSAAIAALGLGPGSEVIVPGYTCVVVPNAFEFAGVRVIYCDIELETYGPDLASVERLISPRTRAVLVHHLYGLVCRDLVPLLELARQKNLILIEDCAHATGARYRGARLGTFGRVGFYSSERSKVFSTVRGGMAVTNDEHTAHELQRFADAAPWPEDQLVAELLQSVAVDYERYKSPLRLLVGPWLDLVARRRGPTTSAEEIAGQRPSDYGCRLPAPLAAIGMNQLKKLDSYNQRRRATAQRWHTWCTAQGLTPPRVMADSEPVFLRYPVRVTPERKQQRAWAERELGVSAGSWFKSQKHPAPGEVGDCPNARSAVATCINLPCLFP